MTPQKKSEEMTTGFELLTLRYSELTINLQKFKTQHRSDISVNSCLKDGSHSWETSFQTVLSSVNPSDTAKQTNSAINKLGMPNEERLVSIQFRIKCYPVCTN
jgi:hypothetical protein